MFKDSVDIYHDPQFVGLVGLYNPSAKPTVDCQYVNCPAMPGISTIGAGSSIKSASAVQKPGGTKKAEAEMNSVSRRASAATAKKTRFFVPSVAAIF